MLQAFEQLLEMAEEKQRAWIDAQYGDDPEVAAMLYAFVDATDGGLTTDPEAAPTIASAQLAALCRPRRVLDRFDLGTLIGVGGSGGCVLEARDVLRDRKVAVKFLPAPSAAARRQMYREAVVLRGLDLPGVVQYYAEGEADEHVLIVMEHVEGLPFGAETNWPAPRVATVLRALLETLARVHARGVLHNDLKPPNVLCRHVDDLPVLLDLGIGSSLDRATERTPLIGGTPAYMAPERMRSEPPTQQSDLFACALMAWEALLGRPLGYERGAPRDQIVSVRHAWSNADRDRAVAEAPAPFADFLRACLDPDPRERPRDARAALALLDGQGPTTCHPVLQGVFDAGTPPDPASLEAVFVGIESVLKMRSRAAILLHRHGGQDPISMQAFLDAAERARLGHWEADGFHFRIAGLDRLERDPSLLGLAGPDSDPVTNRPSATTTEHEALAQLEAGQVADALLCIQQILHTESPDADTEERLAIALHIGLRADDAALLSQVRSRIEHAPLNDEVRDTLRTIAQAATRTANSAAAPHLEHLQAVDLTEASPSIRAAVRIVRDRLLTAMPVEAAAPHLAEARIRPRDSLSIDDALLVAIHCLRAGDFDDAAKRLADLDRRDLGPHLAERVVATACRCALERGSLGQATTYLAKLRVAEAGARSRGLTLRRIYLERRLHLLEHGALAPDAELPAAARAAGQEALAVVLALLEGGSAWHAGDNAQAAQIVAAAGETAPSVYELPHVALLHALALELGIGTSAQAERAFDILMAEGAHPTLQLQTAALLCNADCPLHPTHRIALTLALRRIPLPQGGYRRELLSMERARDLIDG